MNKQRRDNLGKAIIYMQNAKTIIENVKEEENTAFDNLPENLQSSFRGCDMEDKINELEDVIEEVDNIISQINDIRY